VFQIPILVVTKMKALNVFLMSDTWEQINGISSLYRSVFHQLVNQPSVSREARLTWIYPSITPAVQVCGPVTFVGLRPAFLGSLPGCSEVKTGFIGIREIDRLCREFGAPNIIHIATQGPFGLTARRFAARRSIPCSGFYHTNWLAYYEAYVAKFASIAQFLGQGPCRLVSDFESWFYAPCELVFCHTKFPCRLPKEGKQKVVQVSQFLDTVRFPIHGIKGFGKKKEECLSLIYVGRLAAEKSVDAVLRHAGHPRIRVNVVGDGPLRAELSKRYPAAVYHGYLDGAALVEAIEACDYMVLPSRSETLGLVVLESAALGVPTILLRGETPSQIVEGHSAGILVDSFEGTEWIELARSLKGSHHYRVLVAGCREMARSHSARLGTKRMLDSWRDLVCVR
jgi:glycosyltransferase involved in cell wall biosynthesis